jgi:hypothetical protein
MNITSDQPTVTIYATSSKIRRQKQTNPKLKPSEAEPVRLLVGVTSPTQFFTYTLPANKLPMGRLAPVSDVVISQKRGVPSDYWRLPLSAETVDARDANALADSHLQKAYLERLFNDLLRQNPAKNHTKHTEVAQLAVDKGFRLDLKA